MTATQDRTPAYTSTYKKLAVKWLIEALCFVSRFCASRKLSASKSAPSPGVKTLY